MVLWPKEGRNPRAGGFQPAGPAELDPQAHVPACARAYSGRAKAGNEGGEEDGRADGLESTGRRLRSLKPDKQLRGGGGPGGEAPERVLLLHTSSRELPGPSGLRHNLYRDLRHPRRITQALLDDRGLRDRRLPRFRGRCPHRGRHRSVRNGGDRVPPGDTVRGFRELGLRIYVPGGFLRFRDQPGHLDTVHRGTPWPLRAVPGHRGHPRDALYDHGQGGAGGVGADRLVLGGGGARGGSLLPRQLAVVRRGTRAPRHSPTTYLARSRVARSRSGILGTNFLELRAYGLRRTT